MDSEFPENLNTTEKQITEAKLLIADHLAIPVREAKPVGIQGCFSKTYDVTLQDGRNVIVQFRIEPLDVGPFATAHQLLGDQVPTIEAIEAPHLTQQKVWPFYMSKVPGATWLEQEEQWQDEQQITCMKSLGRLYAKCFMPGSSDEAVEKVINQLRRIRALDNEDVSPYYELIDHLIRSAPQLQSLPLFYTHFDLNGMNILSDKAGQITGVVDWELASVQPFGIGCGYIHFLAGEIVNKQWQERPAYDAMERGFWASLFEETDVEIRRQLMSNLDAVQTSVLIGTLFRIFGLEGEKIMVAERLLKSLPILAKYRIPALRGSATAYSGEPRRNPLHAGRATS
ncbi:MAG: hypothetical protein M1825_003302 [Sarcosagium campestre]|nr:MAG: hypothetical protein M1825_003302 [Sarcosagium campestre]